jgi:hypothetical protein
LAASIRLRCTRLLSKKCLPQKEDAHTSLV